MPVDDPSDVGAEQRILKKRVERLEAGTGGGDSSHLGSGISSVQIGEDANASGTWSTSIGLDSTASGDRSSAYGDDSYAFGFESTAIGNGAYAGGDQSTAIGHRANADHTGSTAVGRDADTTGTNQVMLGTSGDTVVVPGTFSNPSARHLKQNIIPAPGLSSIFPDLVEYEYIDAAGRRRLGYIADDLIGTDAERFVTFDDEDRPAGIDYLGLLVAQVAQLNARIAELERG